MKKNCPYSLWWSGFFFCLFVEVSIFTSQTFPLLYHFFQSDHFSLQEFADIFESLCKGYDYYFLY